MTLFLCCVCEMISSGSSVAVPETVALQESSPGTGAHMSYFWLSFYLREAILLTDTSLLPGCLLHSCSFRTSVGCCGISWLKGQSYAVLADSVISIEECTEARRAECIAQDILLVNG